MLTNPPLKRSLYLFAIAFLAFLVTGVLLDSALASVPNGIQRALTFVLIILPTIAGTLLAGSSFFKQPRNILLSLVSFLLNLMTALFFSLLIMVAG